MFKKLIILSALVVISIAEAPYAPSGWRPTGYPFDLPDKYKVLQPQRGTALEVDISKQRVDLVRQINENQVARAPLRIIYDSHPGAIQVPPNHKTAQFRPFQNPQLNTGEYYYKPHSQLHRQINPLSHGAHNVQVHISNQAKNNGAQHHQTAQAPPPPNHQFGYPNERPAIEFEDFSPESLIQGEYFILTPENRLQKVTYTTSQSPEQAQQNAFSAHLTYTPVDKVNGPLYKYNEGGQLVRVHKN